MQCLVTGTYLHADREPVHSPGCPRLRVEPVECCGCTVGWELRTVWGAGIDVEGDTEAHPWPHSILGTKSRFLGEVHTVIILLLSCSLAFVFK